jgi:hypothetical protein
VHVDPAEAAARKVMPVDEVQLHQDADDRDGCRPPEIVEGDVV